MPTTLIRNHSYGQPLLRPSSKKYDEVEWHSTK